mgnify:CR=1 FL=1
MALLDYYDKRDSKGCLLGYSALALSRDMARDCVLEIRKYDIYTILTKSLNSEFVDMYFKKYFYQLFEEIASKIVLYKWYINNEDTEPNESIEIQDLSWSELLQEVWPEPSVPFKIITKQSGKNSGILSPWHKIGKDIYWLLRKLLVRVIKKGKKNDYLINESSIYSGSAIAIIYDEGINLNRRSDIFWFQGSSIDPSSVLIYFKNRSRLERYENSKEVIDTVEKYGFRWITMFGGEFNGKKNEWMPNVKVKELSLKRIQKRIESCKPMDNTECWLKEEAKHLLAKVSYWYSFFEAHNVKVHYDPIETGLENIAKNIAIDLLGGCSIGKVRSYPTMGQNGVYPYYYHNHIFFTYGNDSAERYMKSDNFKRNILVSGYPYGETTEKVKKEVNKVTQSLKRQRVKLTFLLLDDMHSMGEHCTQSIYTPELTRFYKFFLQWVIEDNEVGLIVKSKKTIVIENLSEIHPLLDQAEKTGRCYNVTNPLGVKSGDWAQAADFSVAISSAFSGAFIDSVIAGCKGIFYDFPGCCFEEHGHLPDKNAKVIFSDWDEIEKELRKYKNDPSSYGYLGDWSSYLDELDPFRDNRGGERIGTYMRWLQEGFNEGLDRNGAIDRANRLYAEAWGDDKVYYSDSLRGQKIPEVD